MIKNKKTIALASDHAGFELKTKLCDFLKSESYEVLDLGTDSKKRVDYPDYGYLLADRVAEGDVDLGIGICGSGIGISIALNRNPLVRAALCTSVEMAKLSREHNDANVLVLGSRIVSEETAIECLKTFLNTNFEGGRHAERVEKLGEH